MRGALLMLSSSLSAGRSEKASFMTLVTSWESWREISGLTWNYKVGSVVTWGPAMALTSLITSWL